jgi:hypothetical protein
MQTEIQFGIYYYRSSTIVPWCSEAAARKEVEKLLSYGVIAEVRCRRVGAMELCTWVVGRLAEDPDFQALVAATAREMAKGEARQRELRSRSYDDWPFGGLS